ncbi:G2/mitotic-specific cyclin-B3 isoform X2 [Hippoglossus hippoglossus]|uniref:G2/mitotic-specific cyclin-B3 isoform X1 n=1 Tax=Hippoglossus hippoglossus TaxID=8267 RepID=UPI00148C1936|nr:G2/mitotic-specific cyclin-B3 isoform X1 [Hippoglossus hippoglossus]XP_034425167.1 G2/mitotic-specific cyclin-B3 isoform X2 [Hippoglossus hippoglossus]
MPLLRGKKSSVSTGNRVPKLTSTSSENQEEGPQVKRSSSPPHGAPKKRTAFIDITNAHKVHISLPGRKKETTKSAVKKTTSGSVALRKLANLKKSSSVGSEGATAEKEKTEEVKPGEEETPTDAAAPVEELVAAAPPVVREVPAHLQKPQIPAEFDIDSENSEDTYMCPEYAKEIFDYLKQREEKFVLCNYMPSQPSLNPEMRAILIDWLVEVQENFELYHETLYLAVKMTDHYLSQTPVHREMLQLVGSTAMLIASKFEERSPPCVDDFLYICDDAYKREELISMEAGILQTLSFDINIPIPYRFLRRYAKCVSAGMDTLTLARYFCEMSLMDMELIPERGSLLASACLLVALVTRDLGGWAPILQFHSGYQTSDLAPVVRKLHAMLVAPPDDKLKAIRNKYAHKVFFEVASLPVVDMDILEIVLLQ